MFRITTGTAHHIDLFYTELAFRLVKFLLKVKAALLKLQGKNLNGYTSHVCFLLSFLFVHPQDTMLPERHWKNCAEKFRTTRKKDKVCIQLSFSLYNFIFNFFL